MPSAWLTAFSCALVLAGCGGNGEKRGVPPKLPHAVGARLADQSARIAGALQAGDRCRAATEARALQAAVRRAINSHQVPEALLENLASPPSVLVDQLPLCVEQPTAPVSKPGKGKGRGKHKGKGHDHGEGGD